LEAEVSKLTKALEQARNTYQQLQKQYQEQCGMFFSIFTLVGYYANVTM